MILDTVKKTIKTHNLLQRKDKVLIAYSGGPDSTALLSLLLELRELWNLELFLAHFNHKLRSKAEEDEKFASEVARKNSLPFFLGVEDVRCFARERKVNTEEAGRELRYDFLKKTASRVGANKIATGHTMSDQAETFLMRLLRGSGLLGLSAIYPAVEEMIIRPLIDVERKDIVTYLRGKDLPYRVDESNFDRRFFRNKIRLELIPYIQKHFEPRIVPHLGRITSILQAEEALLEELGKEKAQRAIEKIDNQAVLKRTHLVSLPLALQRRVMREFLLRLKGDLREVSFTDIESVLSLGKEKEFQLKKNLILRRQGDIVGLKERNLPRVEYEYCWEGKDSLHIQQIDLNFEGRKARTEKFKEFDFDDRKVAFLDKAKLRFPLIVRNRRKGDRYRPLGAPGKKKLKEIMRAKGIPARERERRPVFLSAGEIVWVLGLPVSEEFKIDEKTEEVFVIKRS
jgi:tRNA(Ile)-lysidine synthase